MRFGRANIRECLFWSPRVKGAVTRSDERREGGREKEKGRKGREGRKRREWREGEREGGGGIEEWTDTGNGGGGVWLGEDGE